VSFNEFQQEKRGTALERIANGHFFLMDSLSAEYRLQWDAWRMFGGAIKAI
jgi:hypothetical protein